MLRLSLQLEMGTFSAAISGLIGMAFGMNLNSSLEEVRSLQIRTLNMSVCFSEYLRLLGMHWNDDNHMWTIMEKATLVSW